ncbi:ATPase MORC2A-like isoform X2 [Symsagittifera roscoffensis]|uniref:ATPase MORC2A-like isoform X2 n=1 Tax=Symsagittifera roscoffensis TaxID=84072 RepID=UPI00307BEFE2
MGSYSGLNRAALSFEYLHTNSTTHEFLFGALAELIDNSKDARSKKIEIYSERNEELRGGYMLCFLDDGYGMNREEAKRVITFGRSAKKAMDTNVVGQYGNGLKSGSMRVAKDFIVFSKTKEQHVCIYMSRTFHEDEKIDEVIVPIPSWDSKNRRPFPSTPEDLERHTKELEIIFKHSPFKTEADIFAQFDKIESDSGTLVILIHMKLLDNGEPELDIDSDPTDIIMGSEKGLSHEGLVLERRSLRAYTSILYLEPVMKIYIQGVKVQTRRLANCLYKPKQFKFTSNRFKTRAENDAREAREHAKLAEEKAREKESTYRDLLKRLGNSTNRDSRSKLNLAKNDAEDHRSEAIIKTKLADQKDKMLKDPKILHLIFGFNIENRSCDGMFMYNCGRLIKMYDRTGPQQDGKVTCQGIVGIVDVPYIVLQPAHNKQDFADGKEYRHLLKVMGEHMADYWNDSGIIRTGVTEFWESFGYESGKKWWEPASDEPRFVKRRQLNIPQAIQCDMCLKWRLLPTTSSSIGKQYPPNWVCQNNPDAQFNRCNAPEQKFSFPLIDRKKLNKDNSTGGGSTPNEEKPSLSNSAEMPSFGRTILKKPDVLPPVKIFKPTPLPIIAPTKLNETPKLINQTPLPSKRTSAPDSSSSSTKVARRKSPSPPPVRVKSSSRVVQQQAAVKEKQKPVIRRKSPSPPPAKPKARQARKSPSPEPPKSAALLLSTSPASSSSRQKKKSPSPSPEQTTSKTSARTSTRDRETSKRSAASEADSEDTQSETSSQSSRKTQDSPSPPKKSAAEAKKSNVVSSPAAAKQTEKTASTSEEAVDDSFEPSVGSEVEVSFGGNKWMEANVLEIHSRTRKLKVQFSQKSIPDKWVLPNEVRKPIKEEIVTPQPSKIKERNSTPSSSTKPAASKQAASVEKSQAKMSSDKINGEKSHEEDSTTSTVQRSVMSAHESADTAKIVSVLKSMLKHFCPPGWSETSDIASLTRTQLTEFPLDLFYKQYEDGLRELMKRQVQKKLDQEWNKMKTELEAETTPIITACKNLMKKLFPEDYPAESDSHASWTAFMERALADIQEDDAPTSTTVTNGPTSTRTSSESGVVVNGDISNNDPSLLEVNGNGHDSTYEEVENNDPSLLA